MHFIAFAVSLEQKIYLKNKVFFIKRCIFLFVLLK